MISRFGIIYLGLFAMFSRCLQTDIMTLEGAEEMNLIMHPISMSEDCLYLNIYTPAHAREGSNLPVRVGPW